MDSNENIKTLLTSIQLDAINKNGHTLIYGPTGSGKTTLLEFMAVASMEIQRPRLVIMDDYNSFGSVVDIFQKLGLSTHRLDLSAASAKASIPPFALACRLLEDHELMNALEAAETNRIINPGGLPNEESLTRILGRDIAAPEKYRSRHGSGKDPRNLLGEMLMAAILIITWGDEDAQKSITQAQRWLIARALIAAAKKARQAGKPHPLVRDVALELENLHDDDSLLPELRHLVSDMGRSMLNFVQCSSGNLFDRKAQNWPDADVILLENINDYYEDYLTEDGNKAAQNLIHLSFIDSVQLSGERLQATGRAQVFIIDHTQFYFLGRKIAEAADDWHALNTRLWFSMQDHRDFFESWEQLLPLFQTKITLSKNRCDDRIFEFDLHRSNPSPPRR